MPGAGVGEAGLWVVLMGDGEMWERREGYLAYVLRHCEMRLERGKREGKMQSVRPIDSELSVDE